LHHSRQWFGIFQHLRVLLGDIEQQTLNQLHIGAVVHFDGQIHTACGLCAVVDNVACGEGAVGDMHRFVVEGCEGGVENTHRLYGARHILCFNVITMPKRFVEEQHHSACKVGQVVLRCQTHCQTD